MFVKKTILNALWVLLAGLSLQAQASVSAIESKSDAESKWGKDALLFLSKTSENYGHMVETIPSEDGQKMTFYHYAVVDGNIIFKYQTTGEKMKRNRFIKWFLSENDIYVHSKDFNGKPVMIATYYDQTDSLLLSLYPITKTSNTTYSYEKINMSDLEGFKYLAEASTD